MVNKLIKQIKSELAFLNCQGIKYLVHEADLDACHQDSRTINNRKNKLKEQLKSLNKPEANSGSEVIEVGGSL